MRANPLQTLSCLPHLLCLVTLATPGFATDYWVSPSGRDGNPGSRAQPFKTISYGVKRLRAGDTLHIDNGVYPEQVFVTDVHGRSGSPITIRGESRDGVRIRGLAYNAATQRGTFPYDIDSKPLTRWYGIHIQDASYVTIESLTVEGTVYTGIKGQRIHHLTINEVDVTYTGGSGINLDEGALAANNDVKVLRCTLDRTNLVTHESGASVQKGAEALTISKLPGFEVGYCTVRNSFAEGIDAKFNPSAGIIHDNIIEFTRATGIYLNEGSGCVVRDNTVRDTFKYQTENGTILRSGQYFGTSKVGVANAYGYKFQTPDTIEHGGHAGISVSTGDLRGAGSGRATNNKIYRNIIYRTWRTGIVVNDAWPDSGANPKGNRGVIDGIDIWNNTVWQCDLSTKFAGFGLQLADVMTNSSVHNNVLSECAIGILMLQTNGISAAAFLGERGNSVSHHVVYRWATKSGQPPEMTRQSNTVLADPQFTFTSPNAGAVLNLRMPGSSPTINRGTDLGLPFVPPAPDIGAYELNTGPNTFPVAVDDRGETDKNTSVRLRVLTNDRDPDGNPLAISWIGQLGPSNGTARINADGSITYTPNPTYQGRDTFTYTVNDGNGGFATANVDVIVSRPNVRHYGNGTAGYAGKEPFIETNLSPYIGSKVFSALLSDARPRAPGLIIVGLEKSDIPILGISQLVVVAAGFPRSITTDAQGRATSGLPIPWNPLLAGQKMYAQFILLDSSGPRGFTATKGMEMTFFNNTP